MEGPAREEIGWIGLVFSGVSNGEEKKKKQRRDSTPSSFRVISPLLKKRGEGSGSPYGKTDGLPDLSCPKQTKATQ